MSKQERERGRNLDLASSVAAAATGLPVETCRTLFEGGWSLEQRIDEPTRWIHPSARIEVGQHE